MSSNEIGKKLVEEEHLRQFLDAYATITGDRLTISGHGESPDFICTRPNGEVVGVECTRSPHDFQSAIWDRIWSVRKMFAPALLAAVCTIIAGKERKRISPHWRMPDNTILVIELLDYTFDSLTWTTDITLADDFAGTGFVEIWLADHSTMEAYGEVRLLGLFPRPFWGVHRQATLEKKPYG